jgi:hypothetical protein
MPKDAPKPVEAPAAVVQPVSPMTDSTAAKAPTPDSMPPPAQKGSAGAKGKSVHAPLPERPPTPTEDSALKEKQRQKRAKEGRQ